MPYAIKQRSHIKLLATFSRLLLPVDYLAHTGVQTDTAYIRHIRNTLDHFMVLPVKNADPDHILLARMTFCKHLHSATNITRNSGSLDPVITRTHRKDT